MLSALAVVPSAHADPTVVGWGAKATVGVPEAATTLVAPTPLSSVADATAAAIGAQSSFALTPRGVLAAGSGYLGLSASSESNQVPFTLIPGTAGTRAIATGANATLLLAADGTVSGFGINQYGAAGNTAPATAASPTWLPTPIAGLTDVTAVGTGQNQSLALKSDGSVWAWGFWRTLGRAGATSADTTGVPQRVTLPVGHTATAIAVGSDHDLALLDDGSVWAWGRNQVGQIGNGDASSTDVSAPVQVIPPPTAGAPRVSAIAAGARTSFALYDDGSFRAWGYNALGSLGLGNGAENVSVPTVPVARAAEPDRYPAFSRISAVGTTTYAIADGAGIAGRVWAWGDDGSGQLGFGAAPATYAFPFPYPAGPPAGSDPGDYSTTATEIPQLVGRLKQASWLGAGSVGRGQISTTEPTLRPDLGSSSSSFYQQPVGTVSARQHVRVRSLGDASTIQRVRLVGANAEDFEIVGYGLGAGDVDGVLPLTVNTDRTLSVDVRFVPTALGERNATLQVTSVEGETANVVLDGFGTPLPGSIAGPTGPAGPVGPQGPAGISNAGRTGVVAFAAKRSIVAVRRGRTARLPFILVNGTGETLARTTITSQVPAALRATGGGRTTVAATGAGRSRNVTVKVAVGSRATLGTRSVKVKLTIGGKVVTRTVKLRVTR